MIRTTGVFFLILLKILGVTLLILLALLLLILLLVLFVPLRYQVQVQNERSIDPGQYHPAENLQVQLKINWLLHLINVSVSYGPHGFHNRIRAAGIDILKILAWMKQKKEIRQIRRQTKKGTTPHVSEQTPGSGTQETAAFEEQISEKIVSSGSEQELQEQTSAEGRLQACEVTAKTEHGQPSAFAEADQTEYGRLPVSAETDQAEYGQPPDFAVRNQAEYGQPPDFAVRSQAEQDQPPDFAVRNQAEQDQPSDFAVRSQAEQDQPSDFAVRSQAEQDQPSAFGAEEVSIKMTVADKDTHSALKKHKRGKKKKKIFHIRKKRKTKRAWKKKKDSAHAQTPESSGQSPGIFDRLRSLYSGFRKEIGDEANRYAVGRIWSELLKIIRCYRPKKLKADVSFSLADPALTGHAVGLISLMPLIYRYPCSIIPDFTSEQLYFEGRITAQGKVRIYVFVLTTLRLLCDKKFMRVVRRLTRREY